MEEERQKDAEQKNPEDRNVIEGPALQQLRDGTMMRDGRRYDVSPPEDPNAFRWHPDDLRIPLGELKQRYDPEVWQGFELWSRRNMVQPGTTVWNWLSSNPMAEKATRSERERINRVTDEKVVERANKRSIEDHEYANSEDLQRDSERFFAGGEKAFGELQRVWGTALERGMVQSLNKEWSAQVTAAATGRKPLFHESIGESAPQIANALRLLLPNSVEVRATGMDLFVYRPSVISKLADPARPLWEQVKEHANDGRWLGYGANFPGDVTVRVQIMDETGKLVSGFRAPAVGYQKYADARAEDFTIATGQSHFSKIFPDD